MIFIHSKANACTTTTDSRILNIRTFYCSSPTTLQSSFLHLIVTYVSSCHDFLGLGLRIISHPFHTDILFEALFICGVSDKQSETIFSTEGRLLYLDFCCTNAWTLRKSLLRSFALSTKFKGYRRL